MELTFGKILTHVELRGTSADTICNEVIGEGLPFITVTKPIQFLQDVLWFYLV